MSPGMTFINSGLTLAVYWIGAGLIERAASAENLRSFRTWLYFSNYAMQVIAALCFLI